MCSRVPGSGHFVVGLVVVKRKLSRETFNQNVNKGEIIIIIRL